MSFIVDKLNKFIETEIFYSDLKEHEQIVYTAHSWHSFL